MNDDQAKEPVFNNVFNMLIGEDTEKGRLINEIGEVEERILYHTARLVDLKKRLRTIVRKEAKRSALK